MQYQRATKSAQKEQSKTASSWLHQTSLNRIKTHPLLELQRTIGNQAVLNILRSRNMQTDTTAQTFVKPRFSHDFSQIPIHSPQGAVPQTKLTVNQPGDVYEREADQVADQVMRMPEKVPLASAKKASVESSEVKVQGERTFEFNLHDLNAAPRVLDSVAVSEKSVEGGEQNFIDDLLVEHAPAEKNGDGGVAPAPPAPVAPAKVKEAGVDSFEVKWSKHSGAGAADAKLRLDYTAKFKKDADHDPTLAEFRQSVMSTWDITDGPHKGRKGTSAPMHDDHYSRADDLAGHTTADVAFYSNDNPGYADLDKDDDLDYSFTAEQTIIDTSQANKVIAKRGPHTATVQGKHPRTYKGVPKTLS